MGIKSQLRFYCEIEYGRAFAIHQRNNYSLFMKIRNTYFTLILIDIILATKRNLFS